MQRCLLGIAFDNQGSLNRQLNLIKVNAVGQNSDLLT